MNSTVNLFCFISFQMVFLNNQLYWHFLYCFGFNLKKKSCRKVNIYNQQLNFWWNNWRLHNWCCRKPRLTGFFTSDFFFIYETQWVKTIIEKNSTMPYFQTFLTKFSNCYSNPGCVYYISFSLQFRLCHKLSKCLHQNVDIFMEK